MCKPQEVNALNQSILTSINMLSNGCDVEYVEARIQVALEIAEGLGVELEIPTSRRMLFQRIGKRFREKLDGVI